MMLGGGMMFGVGLLMLLLVIVLPILLIAAIFAGIFGMTGRQSNPSIPAQNTMPGSYGMPSSMYISPQQSQPAVRSCTHCDAELQAGWTYCPQCGAPVNP